MIYLIDTSSLICLINKYPEEIFKTLYENFNNNINNGNIKSPIQVLHEIKQKDDILYKWLINFRKIFFIETDNEILQKAAEIINNYPELIKNLGLSNTGEDPADPYLIATGIIMGRRMIDETKIITEEGNKKNHIPDISGKYNIKSMHILEFFKEMKWKF